MRRVVPFLIVLLAAGSALWTAPGAGQGGPVAVSPDSIVATARDLTGETGVGPDSRAAPRPSTALYADYLRRRVADAMAPWSGSVALRAFDPGFEEVGGDTIRHPYTNVVGWIPAASSAERPGFFLLGAHFDAIARNDPGYDEQWRTHPAPGADDNASGVATVLEALRAGAARGLVPRAHVLVTFFDGEEQQVPEPERFLIGSTVMADDDLDSLEAKLGPLHGFVNLDMVAYNPRRDSLVVLTNLRSRGLANTLLDVRSDAAIPDFDLARVVEGLTFSDHGPFWGRDRDAVLIIENPDIRDHAPHYHRASDTVDAVFSRGGSQAAKGAELLVSLLDLWSTDSGPSALTLTDDDILVESGPRVDAPQLAVGQDATLRVGVTNRGAAPGASWSVAVDIELDGRVVDGLEPIAGDPDLVPGGRQWFRFPWTPEARHAGSPLVRARIEGIQDAAVETEAARFIAVEGEGAAVLRAYVYPNPTRMPRTAVLHYELAVEGPVRLELFDVAGRSLGVADRPYDPVFPDPGVDVGAVDLPLADLFPVDDLAPGLYLLQVRQFDRDGASVATHETVRFAVLR